MGVNYYQTCVAEYNDITGVGMTNIMNTTGVKGTAVVQGILVYTRTHLTTFYQQLIGIGQLILWDSECAAVKLHLVIIYLL